MKIRQPSAFAALLLAVVALPLAACGKKEGEGDARTASGEVLAGTISDEMLPLDTLTSEPPRLKIEAPTAAATATPEDAAAEGVGESTEAAPATAAATGAPAAAD